MIAIFGAGFGLYGYLPALAGPCGQRIALPARYRAKLEARAELAPFAAAVTWCADEEGTLGAADGVVIARRPEDQPALAEQCLSRPGVARLLLEKPLAPKPDDAVRLLDRLVRSRKTFRIGYTFRYTPWAAALRAQLGAMANGGAAVSWEFRAHHFRHDLRNWKRSQALGGGALRFYGIQLIAELGALGYDAVSDSETFGRDQDEIEGWRAAFAGPRLPAFTLVVDSNSPRTRFAVALGDAPLVERADPFEAHAGPGGTLDRRVGVLAELARSLWQPDGDLYEGYARGIELWRRVEARTQFRPNERPAR